MRRRLKHGWWLSVPLALAVSACLPEGLRVPQSPLSRLLEPKSGTIAFLAADGNIYTTDQGGTSQTQITTDAFVEGESYRFYNMPTWSPDNQSLAFASFAGDSSDAPSDVALLTANPDGSNLVTAYSSPNFVIFYYWSPDGKRVGFISETPTNSLVFQVVPREGGDATLVDAGSPYYWTWAPDSSAVMAHAGTVGSAALSHVSLLKLDPQVAEYGLDLQPGQFKAPAFSPDGSQVLVAAEVTSNTSALLLTDAFGDNALTLAEYTGHIAFVWSPDGKRVAYLTTTGTSVVEPGQLTVVDPAGQQQPVTLEGAQVYAFFWSPDNKKLAYFVETPAEEVEAADVTASSLLVSPDNFVLSLRVMDVNSGKTHAVADFVGTERFLQILPYFDQYDQAMTIWSPDSKNMLLSAYRGDGAPGIWVAAESGNLEPRFIAPGWVGAWSWK